MAQIKSRKNRFVYLVYCNPINPIVYGVYSNKKAALEYAMSLIDYRFDHAKKNFYKYGFYHYETEDKSLENDFTRREKYIFSACLQMKDGKSKDDGYSYDGCLIQVIRREITK